jgi:putative hydrolase of the HAD superfamily
MKYKVIMFDADDTLFDFKKCESDAFKNTMLEFNIEYDEKHHLQEYSAINSAMWKEFEDGLVTQEKLKVERFKRLSEKINTVFNEVEFARSYSRHLSNTSFLYDDSMGLVKDLYKNYRLTLITNGLKDVQDNRLRKSVIGKYFEDIVISEEVQVAKPDPKIFELALNNIKHTDKSSVLMVGDSLNSDIQGGINFGIDTCWFNPNRIVNRTRFKPTYEISNLMELKSVLGK